MAEVSLGGEVVGTYEAFAVGLADCSHRQPTTISRLSMSFMFLLTLEYRHLPA